MPDENKFLLTGTLTDEPELQRSKGGNAYIRLRFEVAFGEGKANYFPAIAFGDDAISIDELELPEGARVVARGRLGRSKRNPDQKYAETDLIVIDLKPLAVQPVIEEPEPKAEPSNGEDEIPF